MGTRFGSASLSPSSVTGEISMCDTHLPGCPGDQTPPRCAVCMWTCLVCRKGSVGGSCCGNPHSRSTGTEHRPPRKRFIPCALSDPCSPLLHLLAFHRTEQAADIQREKGGKKEKKKKKETRNGGNSFHQKCPGFGIDSHSMTWVVVLQLRSAPSLPGAHSLPLPAPSFAGIIADPCMPEP